MRRFDATLGCGFLGGNRIQHRWERLRMLAWDNKGLGKDTC